MSEPPKPTDEAAELPTRALVMMVALGWAGMVLGLHSLQWAGLVATIRAVLSDGTAAVVVLLAAATVGRAISRPFRAATASAALSLASAAALGLWALSVLMLAAGSLGGWGLSRWFWWPVIAVGAGAGLLQLHRPLSKVRLRRMVSGRALVWVLVAAGAAIWLSGAKTPAGQLGNLSMDSREVLSARLEVPREFYDNGRIGVLEHNVHSRSPLPAEMLFLLAMVLRGGAYEGMVLARMLVGLFGAVAVVGAFGELRRGDDFRARAAVALLATAPWWLYLSWIALPDLATMGATVLSLLWLRRWMAEGSPQAAVWAGLMAGIACAAGHESIAVVAAPIVLVMPAILVARTVSRRTAPSAAPQGDTSRSGAGLWGVVWAVVAGVAMLSPWLVRSAAVNGNPVFPYALRTLGAGPWGTPSGELNEHGKRWVAAHRLARGEPLASTQPPASAGGYQQHAHEGTGSQHPAPEGESARPPASRQAPASAGGHQQSPSESGASQQPPPEGGGSRQLLPEGGGRRDGGGWRYRIGAFFLNAAPYHLHPALGAGVVVVLLGALLGAFIRPRGPTGWDWALLGVLVLQLGAWALLTPGMPARAGAVCAGTIALLCAGGLARLSRVEKLPWLKQAPAAGVWGRAPAAVLLIGIAAINLGSAWSTFRHPAQHRRVGLFEAPNATMLVGETRAFYFPPETVYATVYDAHPLERILPEVRSGGPLAERMREMGVVEVLVHWYEIDRLAETVGWPSAMPPDEIEQRMGSWEIVREEWYPPLTNASEGETTPASRPGLSTAPQQEHGAPTTSTAPTVEPIRILTIYRVPAAPE